MKLYNKNTDTIDNIRVYQDANGIHLVDKYSLGQLNALGLYPLEITSSPNRRYYTSTALNGIVGAKYVMGYEVVERDLNEVKTALLKDLSITFKAITKRPSIDTGLGYNIDGGREDLVNFQIGKEFSLPFIKDVDGNSHPATILDYEACLLAIKAFGLLMYQRKWEKEVEIEALPTLADCIIYEATPYEAMVDIIDDSTLLPTGEQELRTLFKNKVKDWTE